MHNSVEAKHVIGDAREMRQWKRSAKKSPCPRLLLVTTAPSVIFKFHVILAVERWYTAPHPSKYCLVRHRLVYPSSHSRCAFT